MLHNHGNTRVSLSYSRLQLAWFTFEMPKTDFSEIICTYTPSSLVLMNSQLAKTFVQLKHKHMTSEMYSWHFTTTQEP